SHVTHLHHGAHSADRAYRRNVESLIKLRAARLKAVAPPVPEAQAISQPQYPDAFAAEIGFVPANGHAYRRNPKLLIKLLLARLKAVAPPASEPEAILQPDFPDAFAAEIGFVVRRDKPA